FFQRYPVATLSTGYILIDGGRVTSVEAVSQTRPLPADKPELAAAHATAARLIGMQAIYLEAGSGAPRPVGTAVIRAWRVAGWGHRVLRRQRRQRRGRAARRRGVRRPLWPQPARTARRGVDHRYIATHRVRQRPGLRRDLRPPDRGPRTSRGPGGAALDERRE